MEAFNYMKIGIVIPTFRKLDGSTYNHLKKALDSVKAQTHTDYKVFLIGDNYTNNDELIELSKIIDDNKIYVENLPVAVERIKYAGGDLWATGGGNASNVGIRKSLEDGYDYICLLDHDDYFFENHLKLISDCIESRNTNFITTKCGPFPDVHPTGLYTMYRPKSSHLYKLTTCVNFKYFNMFFRDMLIETGKPYPGDADLWNRITKFLTTKNEFGVFINVVTCARSEEGVTIKKPHIIK